MRACKCQAAAISWNHHIPVQTPCKCTKSLLSFTFYFAIIANSVMVPCHCKVWHGNMSVSNFISFVHQEFVLLKCLLYHRNPLNHWELYLLEPWIIILKFQVQSSLINLVFKSKLRACLLVSCWITFYFRAPNRDRLTHQPKIRKGFIGRVYVCVQFWLWFTSLSVYNKKTDKARSNDDINWPNKIKNDTKNKDLWTDRTPSQPSCML